MKDFFNRMARRGAAVLLSAALVLGAGDFSAYRGISVFAAEQVTGGADEANAVTVTESITDWNGGCFKVSGEVTLNDCARVYGNVTLILEANCKLTTSYILVVSGNSLTIKGEGELVADATNSQSAGIGGHDVSNKDSGTIIIEGGTITATGGTDCAGIGGSEGGSNGSVIIKGGNVTANGGERGAGIGGGDEGSGGSITIEGGTVNATGGNYKSDGGIINISGGTVTAIGSWAAAGIGGGNNGTGGDITISGGTVTATGGKYGAYVESNCAGIGYGVGGSGGSFSTGNGNAFIIATSGKPSVTPGITDTTNQSSWSGLIFSNNEGKLYGSSYTITEDVTIPSGATLTVDSGKTLTIAQGGSLTGEGKINGEGTFLTENLTEDMITVPSDLVYNGNNRSGDIKTALIEQGLTATICGQAFKVTGWGEPQVTTTDNFNYTITYTKGTDPVTKTVTLKKSGANLTATLADNKTDYAYSDTITITAKVTPTGEAPTAAVAMLADFAAPTAGQIAVYNGDTQVSEPQTPDENGVCTFTILANDLGAGAHTLTVKYVASDVMAEATVEVKVLNVAECTHPNVTFDDNYRFYCSECGEYIVARTDVGNDSAYYTSIEAAWDAAVAAGQEASVILERGGAASTDKTLTVPSGANITLVGSKFNPLTSSCDCIRVDGGTLNIENAYITASSGHAVTVDSGTLKITSGTYTGNTCGLYVSGGNVMLTGGIFNDIKTSGSKFLDSLLADGYAYKRVRLLAST